MGLQIAVQVYYVDFIRILCWFHQKKHILNICYVCIIVSKSLPTSVSPKSLRFVAKSYEKQKNMEQEVLRCFLLRLYDIFGFAMLHIEWIIRLKWNQIERDNIYAVNFTLKYISFASRHANFSVKILNYIRITLNKFRHLVAQRATNLFHLIVSREFPLTPQQPRFADTITFIHLLMGIVPLVSLPWITIQHSVACKWLKESD